MAIMDPSNLEKLQFYYDHFVKWEKFDEIKQERKERMEELQRILAKDKIDSLTEDEISRAFGRLWSVGVRFQGELVKNNNIEKIRNTLNYLLYDETEEIHTRYEKVSEHPDYSLKMFSDSRISEILIKVRPDYGISLVNKRIVRLVDRLNLHVEYGASLAEKSKAYDKITKEIQEKFDFKDLDETDMFVWFIDEFPKFFSDEEPLNNSEEFAFIEKDFASTTGIKEDAQYLRNRFKSFQKVLKEKLPEEFSGYKSYVSRVNKRPIPGQEVKYYDIVWMGFAEDKYIEKRVQESIQFQVTVTKEYVSSDIWISFVGKKKITDVKTIIENNKEEFLKIIHQLPSDYFIGAYIRGNEEEREFSLSQVTPKELELILEWMGKSNAEFSIGYWWDKEKVLEFGTNITDEVVGTFEKLAPVYHFINRSKIAQNPTKTMTTNEEYGKFSELLDMKNQIIFYGPPGTGKTHHAVNFARELIKNNTRKKNEDEPTSKDKTEWFNYLKRRLREDIPKEYSIDNPGEEYFVFKSANDEKRIRVFYGNKEKNSDSVEVGFKEKPLTWLSKVPEHNRYFLIINLSNSTYVLLPYSVVKNYAQFRGGQHWDPSGVESMWFTMTSLTEDNAILRANDSADTKQFDCKEFLFNLDGMFVSDIEFITFHPSYSYEEFMEGIRAKITESNLEYYIDDGIFKRICKAAKRNRNKNCKYVLIIDEINRGNISKIFGELITIIEKGKRGNISVGLTYSKEKFTVPENVYIIGTMNTADRSLTQVDVALRRRFAFSEFLPDYGIINSEIQGINLANLLEKLNGRIREEGLREKQIGHAYFMNNEAPITKIKELKHIFENEIIPLLQDYFYEDYEKIKKIIGPAFINEKEMAVKSEWKVDDNKFVEALKEIVNK